VVFHRSLKQILAVILLAVFTHVANAHVKWFSPYDTAEAPLDIKSVLSIPNFWLVFFLSVIFIFFMVFVDTKIKAINRYIDVVRYKQLKKLPEDFAYRVFTLTLIIFFACVWTIGGVVLTPELKHSSNLVSTIQILIIASLMTRKTAKYAGFGIFALWIYGVSKYGLFHVADYMIFLGIAFFMIKGGHASQYKTNAIAFFILYLFISWTLQWASVEKWVYPEWSYPLLESRPYLTMGFSKEIFMVMAGFVEFTLAFLLVVLTGAGFIVTAISLAVVFILAIIDFGKVDAIGHLAIIVALFVMAIKGPCKLNFMFASLADDPFARAQKVTACYVVSLAFFVTIYYGTQFVYNNYLRFH